VIHQLSALGSIPADPNRTYVCNVWVLRPMRRFSKYFCRLLEKVPRAPITIVVVLALKSPLSPYLKGQVDTFLLFLTFLEANPAINRTSDVNEVAFASLVFVSFTTTSNLCTNRPFSNSHGWTGSSMK